MASVALCSGHAHRFHLPVWAPVGRRAVPVVILTVAMVLASRVQCEDRNAEESRGSNTANADESLAAVAAKPKPPTTESTEGKAAGQAGRLATTARAGTPAKSPHEKPEGQPTAAATPAPPAARRSPEDLYAQASPAVVTLEILNDHGQVIGSGSGFFLSDRFVKAVSVDVDATVFAARVKDEDELGSLSDRLQTPDTENEVAEFDRVGKVIAEFDRARKERELAREKHRPNLRQAYVVTNQHVIDAAVSIGVRLHDGATGFVSHVIAEDSDTDVAILLAWPACPKPPPSLGVSADVPRIGSTVYAIGSPLGLANSLSEGLVSGIREVAPGRRWFQTTASIGPGSSGGPVLAADGNVVGIATAIRPGGQNLNFAVPGSEVLRLLGKPLKTREVWRGRSFRKEEEYAFEAACTALASRADGRAAAESLRSARWADTTVGLGKGEEPEKAASEAIRSVPDEFRYLGYWCLGKVHDHPSHDRWNPKLSEAERTRLARSNPHKTAALRAFEKVAELKPDFAPAYDRIAGLHISMGNGLR